MSDNRDHLFDVRVVERNIAAGLITRKEYEAWKDGLEDDAGRAANSDTRFVHGEIHGLIATTETELAAEDEV